MKNLAVITGGSGGIGSAIAKVLIPQGYSVVLSGRNEARLAEVVSQLKQQFPDASITAVAADLSEETGRGALLDHVAASPTPLSLVINNAGSGLFGLFEDIPPSELQRVFNINVTAPMLFTQAVLKRFGSAGADLQIINIGSTFGTIGYPGFAGYCATKFALRGWSEALDREYSGSAIRIRYFAPRATRTELNTDAVNAMNEALGVTMDSAEAVAREFSTFLGGRRHSAHIGWPERFFVWLNKVLPNVVSSALAKQVPVIKEYASKR
jgi:short-subunit dehydrogenase